MRQLIVFISAVLMVSSVYHFSVTQSFAGEKPGHSDQPKSRWEKYHELRRNELSMSFAFYGKVVDLDDNPVPGAEVVLRVHFIPPVPSTNEQKDLRLTTDEQGRFSVEEEGFILALDGIEKPGYEYRFQYSPIRQFRFYKDRKNAELGQLPDQPIVFKVRKMGEPALVLHKDDRFGLHPGGKPAFFDLLWRQWAFPERLFSISNQFKGWHPDVKLTLEGDRQNCRLVLEALDADTEMVADSNELYESPRQGYQSKLILPFTGFEEGKPLLTYVYVKGRGGQFFTRMHIQATVEKREDPEKRFAGMTIDYLTNPNGEDNFESSQELHKQYREDVSSGKRRRYGYDAEAKGFSIEDVRKILGKSKK